MTWLRIDDGFYFHPKVLKLSRSERWSWVEVLCYCARYETGGEIPHAISQALPKVNKAFVDKCVNIGLLDWDDQGGLSIHDWKIYNPKDPTNAARQERYRNAKRNGSSNGEVTENVTVENVTSVTPRARASRPVPYIEPPNQPTVARDEEGLVGSEIDLDHVLKDVG